MKKHSLSLHMFPRCWIFFQRTLESSFHPAFYKGSGEVVMNEVFLLQSYSCWDDLLNVFLTVCGTKGSKKLWARWVGWVKGEMAWFIFRQGSAFSLSHNGGYSTRPPGPQGHEVFRFGTYSISLIADKTWGNGRETDQVSAALLSAPLTPHRRFSLLYGLLMSPLSVSRHLILCLVQWQASFCLLLLTQG